jgi:hypothetical protein
MIQNLLPVKRELGLVTIFWDVSSADLHSGQGGLTVLHFNT